MENKFDSLPKNVQKLVKKLADIQRKRTAVFREITKGDLRADQYAEQMEGLREEGVETVEKLLGTHFAQEELGCLYPDEDYFKEDLQIVGEYLAGLYALDRMEAERYGKKYSEDMFYAGSYLLETAESVIEPEDDFDEDGLPEEMDEDDINAFLDDLFERVNGELEKRGKKKEKAAKKPKGGIIVPLFGDGKDRIQ